MAQEARPWIPHMELEKDYPSQDERHIPNEGIRLEVDGERTDRY